MDVRFSTDPAGFRAMSSGDLRTAFLIDTLFVADEVPMVYSDIDRSITGSAVPVKKLLPLLSTKKEMAADFFAERREIGIINIGADGSVAVDGREFPMAFKDALYVGRGAKEVLFGSRNPAQPAKFYFVSYPAHREFPTAHAKFSGAEPARLGSTKDANKRTIYKYIHPNGIKSCQLVMGLTELEEGSVWNTMPPHTHQRRSEVYMYFHLPPTANSTPRAVSSPASRAAGSSALDSSCRYRMRTAPSAPMTAICAVGQANARSFRICLELMAT